MFLLGLHTAQCWRTALQAESFQHAPRSLVANVPGSGGLRQREGTMSTLPETIRGKWSVGGPFSEYQTGGKLHFHVSFPRSVRASGHICMTASLTFEVILHSNRIPKCVQATLRSTSLHDQPNPVKQETSNPK